MSGPDFRRVRTGDWLSGAFGVALFFGLWLEWFEFPEGGASAWETFGLTDVILAAVAVAAMAVPLVTAFRHSPAVPLVALVIAITLSLLALLLVLYRLVNQPGANDEASLAAGAWIGALCTAGAFVCLAFALRDESSPGLEPGPDVPVLPSPPREVAGTEPAPPA